MPAKAAWPARLASLSHPGLLLSVLALGGCQEKVDPVVRAREDARAVAMVEAAQKINPPPVALTPQPLSPGDLATDRLTGSGCRFFPGGPDDAPPILVANGQRALLRSGGRLTVFAADRGSAELIPALHGHYVGKSHSLTLERSGGDGTELGLEGVRWGAVLTIRDAWDQIVFTAPGRVSC